MAATFGQFPATFRFSGALPIILPKCHLVPGVASGRAPSHLLRVWEGENTQSSSNTLVKSSRVEGVVDSYTGLDLLGHSKAASGGGRREGWGREEGWREGGSGGREGD